MSVNELRYFQAYSSTKFTEKPLHATDSLKSLCTAAITKHQNVESTDYYYQLIKQAQRLPIKRYRDPSYSKRLSACLRDAKRNYYRKSREVRITEKSVTRKMTTELIAATEDLESKAKEITKVLQENPPSINIELQLKNVEEAVNSLTDKLEKTYFKNWNNTLKNSASELKKRLASISDPTDYDHYIDVLKRQWKDASLFQNEKAVYNEIVEDVLAKLFNFPSRKERVKEESRVKTLILYSFDCLLAEAYDSHAFKNIGNYEQLETTVWKNINDLRGLTHCNPGFDIVALTENRTKRASKRQKVCTNKFIDKLEIISQETDEIIEPAYNRGMCFAEEQSRDLCKRLESIDTTLQKHTEAIQFLINPLNEDLAMRGNLQQSEDAQPISISYVDDDCHLSTALSIMINEYTKQSMSKIQEQIDRIQEQIDQLPNKQ